jgi:hypothetical protein
MMWEYVVPKQLHFVEFYVDIFHNHMIDQKSMLFTQPEKEESIQLLCNLKYTMDYPMGRHQ